MTDFDGMLHEDFSDPDSPELWMADTAFASYPPGLSAGYSTMYDANLLGYQSDFNNLSPSIGSSSGGSPSSDCYEFQPSLSDHHLAAQAQEHLYDAGQCTSQIFDGGFDAGPFDALGIMRVDRLPPQYLAEQPPPRTVHMSDVIVPSAFSPSPLMPQQRSSTFPSMPSPPTVRPTRRRLQRKQPTDEGESEVDSEGDSCPSDANGSPSGRRSAGPASPLFRAPYRRRRHQDVNIPVPIPNLTKKSRGRKVPISAGEPVYDQSTDKSKKGTRTYTCSAEGCGKCFVRSEHLKRHIRSIHTNDKPWVCPVGGCERLFSRRDNLNQHMRIHRSP